MEPPKADRAAVRVLLCGTHPSQQNGYSRVVYELARRLALREADIALTIYGFQRAQGAAGPNDAARALPSNVVVHDAAAAENPKRLGFGEAKIGEFLRMVPQDVVVIYNDLAVTTMLVQEIVRVHGGDRAKRPFKLVSYMDQVYLCQKRRNLDLIEREFDGVITFSTGWADVLRGQLRDPDRLSWAVLEHGIDAAAHHPVTRRLARTYFGIDQQAFVVLNLNRNVPRKRYDHVMTAFASVAAQMEREDAAVLDASGVPTSVAARRPVRFLIGTDMHSCWELPELFEREFIKRGGTAEAARKYLIGISAPQSLTDRDTNILHSVADVHATAADGEGWGLCSFEAAAAGVANVATAVGGICDFLSDDTALLVRPKWHFYIDNSRDQIGGEAEVSDPEDIAAAILQYYRDEGLRARHAAAARAYVTTSVKYSWDRLAGVFADFCVAVNVNNAGPTAQI